MIDSASDVNQECFLNCIHTIEVAQNLQIFARGKNKEVN